MWHPTLNTALEHPPPLLPCLRLCYLLVDAAVRLKKRADPRMRPRGGGVGCTTLGGSFKRWPRKGTQTATSVLGHPFVDSLSYSKGQGMSIQCAHYTSALMSLLLWVQWLMSGVSWQVEVGRAGYQFSIFFKPPHQCLNTTAAVGMTASGEYCLGEGLPRLRHNMTPLGRSLSAARP